VLSRAQLCKYGEAVALSDRLAEERYIPCEEQTSSALDDDQVIYCVSAGYAIVDVLLLETIME